MGQAGISPPLQTCKTDPPLAQEQISPALEELEKTVCPGASGEPVCAHGWPVYQTLHTGWTGAF